MRCLRPIYIDNPRYDPSSFDPSNRKMAVPCGKCAVCVKHDAQEWRVRLLNEFRIAPYSMFVTLTYDDASLPLQDIAFDGSEYKNVPVVSKRDIQLFFKRLRRFLDKKLSSSGYKARYFLVSEYGPNTYRPHYHFLLFSSYGFNSENSVEHREISKAIQKCWNSGFVTVSICNKARIGYVTKYMSCVLLDLPKYLPKPFRLMSRRPGIGSFYLLNESVLDWHRETLSNYVMDGGFKLPLPRYYRDKIFDDAMKEEIRDIAISLADEYKERLIVLAKERNMPIHELRYEIANSYTVSFINKYSKKRKDV